MTNVSAVANVEGMRRRGELFVLVAFLHHAPAQADAFEKTSMLPFFRVAGANLFSQYATLLLPQALFAISDD